MPAAGGKADVDDGRSSCWQQEGLSPPVDGHRCEQVAVDGRAPARVVALIEDHEGDRSRADGNDAVLRLGASHVHAARLDDLTRTLTHRDGLQCHDRFGARHDLLRTDAQHGPPAATGGDRNRDARDERCGGGVDRKVDPGPADLERGPCPAGQPDMRAGRRRGDAGQHQLLDPDRAGPVGGPDESEAERLRRDRRERRQATTAEPDNLPSRCGGNHDRTQTAARLLVRAQAEPADGHGLRIGHGQGWRRVVGCADPGGRVVAVQCRSGPGRRMVDGDA